MTYIKSFIHGMTFTHILLYFNTVSILALILVFLWNKPSSPIGPQANAEVYCPIQHAKCTIDTHLGPIELSVDSPIEPLIPFNLLLTSNNPSLVKAVIRFEGFDDYMGINQFRFTQDTTNESHWTMRGSIPICIIDSKTWRVTLNLQDENNSDFSSHWFKLKII